MTDLLGIATDEQRMRSRAQVIAIVVSAGFVAAVYFHYWLAAYDGASYPLATYLCRTDDNMPLATMHVPWSVVSKHHCFGDLYAPYLQTLRLAPYASEGIFPSNYLPFTHALMLPATLLPYDLLLPLYLACFAAGAFVFCLWGGRELPWLDRVIFALPVAWMSYPPQFLMDRGNLEGVVFAFSALFYICYSRKKTNAAACFLAAAIAMKGYPMAYSLLFALNAQWRQLFLCAAVSIVLTLASAAMFEGGMVHNMMAISVGIAHYLSIMQTDEGVRHACSLYGLLTILHRNLPGLPALMAAAAFCLDNYKWIQAIVGLSLFSACVVLPLRLWEVLSLLSFSFLMLPLSSPDYRLIHLFLPIVAFIRCKKSDFHSLQIAAVAALLLVPKAFVYVDREISIGCVINPALMVIAATFICLRATTRKTEQAPLMASMWKCVVRPVGALVETNGNTPPPLNVHSVRSGPFASITQA
jgi:hypothetical protein